MNINKLNFFFFFKRIFVWIFLSILCLSCVNNTQTKIETKNTDKFKKKLGDENFDKDLKSATFFKNSNDFYILFTKEVLYIVSSDVRNLEDKFMMHFILEGNTFNNHSFTFAEKEINTFYKNFRVAKINIPTGDFVTYRIGQFNVKGNIWAQEFSPTEAMANPLLKYNDEFE